MSDSFQPAPLVLIFSWGGKVAEKLNSEDGERARQLWTGKGKEAFEAEQETKTPTTPHPPQDRA